MKDNETIPWDISAEIGLQQLAELEAKQIIHDELPNVHDLKLPELPLSEQIIVAKKVKNHYEQQNYKAKIRLYTPIARLVFLDMFGERTERANFNENGEFVLPASNDQDLMTIENLIYYQKIDQNTLAKIAFELTWDQELAEKNPRDFHQNLFE